MAYRDPAPRRLSGQKQNTFFGGAAVLALGILATLLVIAVGVKLIPWFIRTVVKLISFPLRKAGVIA